MDRKYQTETQMKISHNPPHFNPKPTKTHYLEEPEVKISYNPQRFGPKSTNARHEADTKMHYQGETEMKMAHDTQRFALKNSKTRCILVTGPIIIGAGPSGLATAACLQKRSVPSLVLERSHCIAALWQLKTYDRLRLHLPKSVCELPFLPFPANYPSYPSKTQFINYLQHYAGHFKISPEFNRTVESAVFDRKMGLWRVRCGGAGGENAAVEEYVSRWVVVATGENAEEVVPEIEGVEEYDGEVVHTSKYKSGEGYFGKKVLVVGCGNSGMEVALDLSSHGALPSVVARSQVHVLPREILGISIFGFAMWLLKWLPISIVDKLLLIIAWFIFGDTSKHGLSRPRVGPLQLKNLSGKTPVLDVGTLNKIRSGEIKVRPGIKCIKRHGVEFVDGTAENFEAIIFATGYRSNVPSWLKEKEMFSEKNGLPRNPFPNGWKGKNGLYAVGFTKRGISGVTTDAKRVAEDIELCWKAESKHFTSFNKFS